LAENKILVSKTI